MKNLGLVLYSVEKGECVSSKIQDQEQHTDAHFHHFYLTLYSAIRQEKEIKAIPFGNKKTKLCLFADSIIFYVENLMVLSKPSLNRS